MITAQIKVLHPDTQLLMLQGIYLLKPGFPGGTVVKNPPAIQEVQEIQVWSLGWEDPLEKETAIHSSILVWRIAWTEKPGDVKSWMRLNATHLLKDFGTLHSGLSPGKGQSWFMIEPQIRAAWEKEVGKESECTPDPHLPTGPPRSTARDFWYKQGRDGGGRRRRRTKVSPQWISFSWCALILFMETDSLSNFGLPFWLSWKRIHTQCGRPEFDPLVGKIPWRTERLPIPVFWPTEFHGL